jgi:hypothetical protein
MQKETVGSPLGIPRTRERYTKQDTEIVKQVQAHETAEKNGLFAS